MGLGSTLQTELWAILLGLNIVTQLYQNSKLEMESNSTQVTKLLVASGLTNYKITKVAKTTIQVCRCLSKGRKEEKTFLNYLKWFAKLCFVFQSARQIKPLPFLPELILLVGFICLADCHYLQIMLYFYFVSLERFTFLTFILIFKFGWVVLLITLPA